MSPFSVLLSTLILFWITPPFYICGVHRERTSSSVTQITQSHTQWWADSDAKYILVKWNWRWPWYFKTAGRWHYFHWLFAPIQISSNSLSHSTCLSREEVKGGRWTLTKCKHVHKEPIINYTVKKPRFWNIATPRKAARVLVRRNGVTCGAESYFWAMVPKLSACPWASIHLESFPFWPLVSSSTRWRGVLGAQSEVGPFQGWHSVLLVPNCYHVYINVMTTRLLFRVRLYFRT